MNIFELVEQLRKERNMSRSKLERLAGVAAGSIIKWKTFKPKFETIEKVANALGIPPQDLMFPTSNVYYGSNSLSDIRTTAAQYNGTRYKYILIDDSHFDPIFDSGDIIVVDTEASVSSEDVVAVNTDNKLQIMRYLTLGDNNTLVPFILSDVINKSSNIIGKIVEVRKKMK